jgi:serpin B
MILRQTSIIGVATIAVGLVAGCSSSQSASPTLGIGSASDASSDGLAPSASDGSASSVDGGQYVEVGDSATVQVDQAGVARDPASSIPSSTLNAAVAANNAFAFDLFGQVVGDGGAANVLTSPLSASLAVTMTYAGAVGETATQMAAVLHADLPDGGSIFDGQNALDQALTGRAAAAFAQAQQESAGGTAPQASDYALQIANAVWGEETYPWASGFLTTLGRSYGTGVYLTDFVHAPGAADTTINDWVSDQTAGKIMNFIPPTDITSATAIVLVNALHVKFPWANPFNTTATQTGTFTRADGSTVSPSFMNQLAFLPYADVGGAQVVELPLFDNQVALLVALPAAGTTLAAYEATLTGASPLVQPSTSTFVSLSIPKIALSGMSFPLTTELQALGMVQAFTPSANFTGMCPPPDGSNIYISTVIQETTLTMQESGLEAAAATAVIGVGSAAPQSQATVTVNRPYLIALVDMPTGAILFLGHVEDPTAP